MATSACWSCCAAIASCGRLARGASRIPTRCARPCWKSGAPQRPAELRALNERLAAHFAGRAAPAADQQRPPDAAIAVRPGGDWALWQREALYHQLMLDPRAGMDQLRAAFDQAEAELAAGRLRGAAPDRAGGADRRARPAVAALPACAAGSPGAAACRPRASSSAAILATPDLDPALAAGARQTLGEVLAETGPVGRGDRAVSAQPGVLRAGRRPAQGGRIDVAARPSLRGPGRRHRRLACAGLSAQSARARAGAAVELVPGAAVQPDHLCAAAGSDSDAAGALHRPIPELAADLAVSHRQWLVSPFAGGLPAAGRRNRGRARRAAAGRDRAAVRLPRRCAGAARPAARAPVARSPYRQRLDRPPPRGGAARPGPDR